MNRHFFFSDLVDPTSVLHRLTPPARLALLGTPVAHSRSPQIHNRLHERRLPWQYVAIDVKPEELSQAFQLLRQSDFIGFNLTMPHKQKALQLIDEITNHAGLLRAINTVTIRDGKFYGSNTDGPGFVAALREEWHFSLQDRSVFILGATGATGGALAMQSLLEGCSQLFLGGRTTATLEKRVKFFSKIAPHLLIEGVLLDPISLTRVMPQVDLIVNTTPVGLLTEDAPSLIPASLFEPRHYVYDTLYSSQPTPLLQAASEAGSHLADGSSMLRLQAAFSLETWLDR